MKPGFVILRMFVFCVLTLGFFFWGGGGGSVEGDFVIGPSQISSEELR